jgi:hypothetical protein
MVSDRRWSRASFVDGVCGELPERGWPSDQPRDDSLPRRAERKSGPRADAHWALGG